MLQCFVRGCKQAQVAVGTKLQDHDLNLEPVHSSTFFSFSHLHITAVIFSKDKPCKPCKRLVSAGNGFLSTDSVYRSLLKISSQENLMILSTGWLKKIQDVPLSLNKAVLCEKKSKQRRWSGHDCTSRGVVVGWVDCQALGHSINSNCGAVRGVDCEHHMDGEVINQQIYSTDWAKSHTKEVFLRRPWPEAGRRYPATTRSGDLARRSPPELSKRYLAFWRSRVSSY